MIGSLGFSEIALIAFVALVVVGPEKLVATAAQLGRFWGAVRRQMNEAQATVQKELAAVEEAAGQARIEADNFRIMVDTGVIDKDGKPLPQGPSENMPAADAVLSAQPARNKPS